MPAYLNTIPERILLLSFFNVCPSRGGVETGAHKNSREFFARVKEPAPGGRMRNADNLAHFGDRFLATIEQVDDFAMSWRQVIYACVQNVMRFLTIKGYFRCISRVGNSKYIAFVNILVRSLPQETDSLKTGDREQPCGNSRTTLEPVRGTLNIEEHLTDQIVRDRRIADHPLNEANYFCAVTGEHDVHCGFVAFRNIP